MVNLFNLPRPDALVEASKSRKLSSLELLILKSRSFSIPILMLKNNKGANEIDKEAYVKTLYNSLRELDTIEDCTLKPEQKRVLMDSLLYVYSEIVRRKEEDSIDDLIDDKLKAITSDLREGLTYNGKLDEEEKVFVNQFGSGEVIRELHGFDKYNKEIIGNCLNNMSIGMREFLDRGITDKSNLKTYCYYVAGSVGKALTEIVELVDKKRLNPSQSEKFGEYLQMVNITKNINEDWEKRKISFIPNEWYSSLSLEDLMNKKTGQIIKKRSQILDNLMAMTGENFRDSLDYINSIPEDLSGYSAFCIIPLITATETLRKMKDSGAEAVFKGKPEAIKIDRETFEKIVIFTDRIVQLDDGRRLKSWGMEYRDNPERYSFIQGDYENWAYNWLK